MSIFSSINYNSLDENDYLYVHEYDDKGNFQKLYRIIKSEFDILFFRNSDKRCLKELIPSKIILTVKDGNLKLVLDSSEQLENFNPFSYP